MSHEDSGAIDRALTEALAGASADGTPVEQGPHPELQDLAAYVDGGLDRSARERLELHLAGCAECRRTAMEASLAIHEGGVDELVPATSARKPSWLAWRPALGLAAALFAVALGLSWLGPGAPTDAERLAGLGVPASAVEAAGPDLVRRAIAALDGEWQRPPGFESFLAGGRPALRGASTAAAPVPLAPRWSVVDAEQPTFAWWLDLAAEEVEILIVDETEELVAAFSPPVESAPGETSFLYPPDAMPLAPGAYAWKVNISVAGEWLASPYVPFRRATAEEQARHQAELARVDASPLLRAVTLASSGRYRPALQALRTVDEPQRTNLIEDVLALQHFSGQDLERERARWAGTSGTP